MQFTSNLTTVVFTRTDERVDVAEPALNIPHEPITAAARVAQFGGTGLQVALRAVHCGPECFKADGLDARVNLGKIWIDDPVSGVVRKGIPQPESETILSGVGIVWGDGSQDDLVAPYGQTAMHTYVSADTYDVMLVVSFTAAPSVALVESNQLILHGTIDAG